MAFDAGAVVSRLELGLSGWKQSVEAVKKDQESMAGFALRHEKGIKQVGTAMTVVGGVLVAGFSMAAKSAAGAAETTSKFGVVFGPVMKDASRALENLADNYGLSRNKAAEMLSGTGDLLTGLGMTSDAGLDLSEKVQQLAVDLASFQNYSGGAEGASAALTKGLLGEREMLKSLGIVINEEMVKNELAARGKQKLTGLALMQEKAYITLELATRQSKNALGDFGRTQDSIVNQTRILNARLDDLKVEVGTALLPVLTDLVGSVVPIVQSIVDWTKENPKLTETLVKVVAAFGAFNLILGPVVMALPNLARGIASVNKHLPGTATKLGKVGAVGAAAFVGWQIGRAIGELTGLDKVLQDVFDSTFRFLGIIKETNYEFGDKRAEYAALQMEAIGKATEISGEKVKNFIQAKKILEEQFGKTGTVGNKALDDWLERLPKVEKKAQLLNVSIEGTEDLFKELGITTRTQLVSELARAETALIRLRKSNERTVGGVLELKDKIEKLKEQLYGTRTIIETKISTVSRYRDMLKYAADVVMGDVLPAHRDLNGVLEKATDRFHDIGRTYPGIVDGAKKTADDMKGAWDGLFVDLTQKWSSDLNTWLKGDSTFKEFREGVWENILETVTLMAGKMATTFTVDFIKPVVAGILGIKTASEGVGGKLAAEFMLVLPVITTILAIIGFIYAFFNWLENKAPKDGGEGGYWPDPDRRPDKGGGSRRPGTGRPGGGGYGDRDTLGGFADGGIAWDKQLAWVAEKEPEIIIPLSKYRSGGGPGGGINVTVHVNGTMVTDSEYAKRRLVPQIIDAFQSPAIQRNVQRALGVSGVGA